MASAKRPMRDALLTHILESMHEDDNIFFLTGDFGSPVLDKMQADLPQRFVNVGIAEQNLINVAGGLALEGFTVFAYAIAPFITMRCYEQTRVNLALLSTVRSMNVNLIGVGAGYSYVVSGPTHQCYEDISIMRTLPNVQVYSPADSVTAAQMVGSCLENGGVKYLRLDAQPLEDIYGLDEKLPFPLGFVEHNAGASLCIVATGYMTHVAKRVADRLEADGFRIGIIDLFDLSSVDQERLGQCLKNYRSVVSLEEGFTGRGGMDALLLNLIAEQQLGVRFIGCGIEGGYRFELGTREELHDQAGISEEALHTMLRRLMAESESGVSHGV
jgi:transketolase